MMSYLVQYQVLKFSHNLVSFCVSIKKVRKSQKKITLFSNPTKNELFAFSVLFSFYIGQNEANILIDYWDNENKLICFLRFFTIRSRMPLHQIFYDKFKTSCVKFGHAFFFSLYVGITKCSSI